MVENKRVTITSIANQVGCSTTTVSRVLNGLAERYRISKSTEESILSVAAELGYTPDQLARGLRMKRTHTIGLIIPDISNPFFSTVARNVEVEARKAEYSIFLYDTQDDTNLEVDSIRLLLSRKIDGLIICPEGKISNHLKPIASSDLPMVIVDRHFPELKCPYVISNNYEGSQQAVDHFISRNHRVIACIQGRLNTSVNNDRIRGYTDALQKHGISIDESLIVGDSFGVSNGYVGAKLLLNRYIRPTAILATSNLISLGAMRAISEEGLRIPDDISIISFDDQPYSDYLATPMTTITQQTMEMGQIAFKLLLAQLNKVVSGQNQGVILPTKLIIRKSVKTLDSIS
ncbi:LacI family DNA-binding transcriptional regulator [Candidatus Neomarinimicrobiota bacterium]